MSFTKLLDMPNKKEIIYSILHAIIQEKEAHIFQLCVSGVEFRI